MKTNMETARSLELLPKRAPRILIVDDDVDSMLLVERVFAGLGCPTEYSLSGLEAKHKICSQKSDVIILDWCLDRQTDAQTIIDQCVRTLAKFGKRASRPRIVTYSSLTAAEIGLKENPYFEYIGHWQKPIDHRQLLHQVLTLLQMVEH